MPSFNKVILMGHLTRNPELRYTPQGTPIAGFGLALNRRVKQGQAVKEEVCFVDVVAWGTLAETASQYLSKGDCVQIDGRLTMRQWETERGERRSKLEVTADALMFVKTRNRSGQGQQKEADDHDEQPYE